MSRDTFGAHELLDDRAKQELEKVVIFMVAGNGETPATITLPDGYKWTDFEEIVFNGGTTTNTNTMNSVIVSNTWIVNKGVNWNAWVVGTSGSQNYGALIDGISSTVASITYEGAGALTSVIGYKKKYATTNLSVEIPVNDGNNIAVNSRYEIAASELPASFLNADGTIKKNVEIRAEIFNNSGVGIADWGDSGIYNDANYRHFVRASIVGDKIVVQSGEDGLCTASRNSGNGFGNIDNILSTTCKVIATLAGEAYVTQVVGGA